MPTAATTRTSRTERPARGERAGPGTGRRVLGRYRITADLAEGGSARVVRARDERLGRDVAIKLLHPHLVQDVEWRRRIGAEARAVADLSHPGIVDVYDVDLDSETPALVMELVEGDSLATVLAQHGSLPAARVAGIGAQVADALYLAHRRGFIHRDVKPGNLIIERRSGRARIVDFGIAHSLAAAAADEAADGTVAGTTIGTLRYMSPEQLRGDVITPRTDLWSLGVVLYEALVGSPPFPGPSPAEVASQQRAGPAPMPAGGATELERAIRSCLQVSVDARPRHAGALAAMLREAAADAVTAPVATPARESARSTPPLRRIMAALTIAGMFMLGFFAFGGDHGTAVAPPSPSAGPLQPLLADYAAACGQAAAPDQLDGLSRADAEAWLSEAIASCQATPTPTPAVEQAAPNGGNGNGNGHGRGNGGGNGNGNGRGSG